MRQGVVRAAAPRTRPPSVGEITAAEDRAPDRSRARVGAVGSFQMLSLVPVAETYRR
jgi:hypothetical protein